MKNNYLRTYNFLVFNGRVQLQTDINAYDEDEAMDLIAENYPEQEGWSFILM